MPRIGQSLGIHGSQGISCTKCSVSMCTGHKSLFWQICHNRTQPEPSPFGITATRTQPVLNVLLLLSWKIACLKFRTLVFYVRTWNCHNSFRCLRFSYQFTIKYIMLCVYFETWVYHRMFNCQNAPWSAIPVK